MMEDGGCCSGTKNSRKRSGGRRRIGRGTSTT